MRVVLEVGEDQRCQHLIDVPLRIDNIPMARTNVPKEDWAHQVAQVNCTPDHDARTTPRHQPPKRSDQYIVLQSASIS